MSKNQLENCASAFVSKNKSHCLLFTYNEEEKEVEIVGDDVWVNALKGNICLMNEISKTLLESSTPSTSTFARAVETNSIIAYMYTIAIHVYANTVHKYNFAVDMYIVAL